MLVKISWVMGSDADTPVSRFWISREAATIRVFCEAAPVGAGAGTVVGAPAGAAAVGAAPAGGWAAGAEVGAVEGAAEQAASTALPMARVPSRNLRRVIR